MRWKVAALIVLTGIAALPGASDAAQAGHQAMLKVSVKPRAGLGRTHFSISFRAAVSTGSRAHNLYRITAGDRARRGCQSGAVAVAPAAGAG
jgi:hypothetical protein